MLDLCQGCDGSVLIASTPENLAERDAVPNLTVRGYEIVDDIKSQVEAMCPGVVSCADILALASRDAVVQVAILHYLAASVISEESEQSAVWVIVGRRADVDSGAWPKRWPCLLSRAGGQPVAVIAVHCRLSHHPIRRSWALASRHGHFVRYSLRPNYNP